MKNPNTTAPIQARAFLSQVGRLGGKKSSPTKGFGSLTPEQRAENAKRAAEARWLKKNSNP